MIGLFRLIPRGSLKLYINIWRSLSYYYQFSLFIYFCSRDRKTTHSEIYQNFIFHRVKERIYLFLKCYKKYTFIFNIKRGKTLKHTFTFFSLSYSDTNKLLMEKKVGRVLVKKPTIALDSYSQDDYSQTLVL